MSVETAKRTSVWAETGPQEAPRAPLERDLHTDVAVIGGGIVGITTALLLEEAGMRVTLLEAQRLACGVSGYTTAKVTSQHGLIYGRLRSRYGRDAARTYAAANEAALAWVADRIERDGIDCDFRRRAAYAYVSDDGQRSKVEQEVEAAAEAGLPATLVETTPLPYPVAAAVRFDDQAEFHPRKYLLPLAGQLTGGVHEHTRALGLDTGERCVIETPRARVTADHVVVATHYPFLDRSLAFARVHPERSYALLCRIAGEPPPGMYISGDSPTRSVRAVPVGGEQLLLVGGEGHKTGWGGNTEERYRTLEAFAREHWDVRSVEYRWSAQDNVTVESLPYVGRLTPREPRVLMATGFAKWGFTGGTAAALILRDLVLGHDNPWAELFDPYRVRPLPAAFNLVQENAGVGMRFVGDRVTKRGTRPIEELQAGEGDIVRSGGEKVAGHRRDDGTLVAVSTRCTHLGCQVNWNTAERSWDCPCHGSRFSPEGEVLQGPAVRPLQPKPVG